MYCSLLTVGWKILRSSLETSLKIPLRLVSSGEFVQCVVMNANLSFKVEFVALYNC